MMERTMSPHLFGSDINTDPDPLRMTFSTGQLMLTSMKSMSGLILSASAAASANVSGLLPKSWRPVNGHLPNSRYSGLQDGLLRTALSEVISVMTTDAPNGCMNSL